MYQPTHLNQPHTNIQNSVDQRPLPSDSWVRHHAWGCDLAFRSSVSLWWFLADAERWHFSEMLIHLNCVPQERGQVPRDQSFRKLQDLQSLASFHLHWGQNQWPQRAEEEREVRAKGCLPCRWDYLISKWTGLGWVKSLVKVGGNYVVFMFWIFVTFSLCIKSFASITSFNSTKTTVGGTRGFHIQWRLESRIGTQALTLQSPIDKDRRNGKREIERGEGGWECYIGRNKGQGLCKILNFWNDFNLK